MSKMKILNRIWILMSIGALYTVSSNLQRRVGDEVVIGNSDTEAKSNVMLIWRFKPDCTDIPKCINSDYITISRRNALSTPFTEENYQSRAEMSYEDQSNNLILRDVQLSDSGTYKLTIYPASAKDYDIVSYILSVYQPPLSLEISPSTLYTHDQYVTAGDVPTHAATCVAEKSKPATQLQWLVDGVHLISSDASSEVLNDDNTVTTTLDLTTVFDSAKHQAVFECVAEQPGTPEMSDAAKLTSIQLNVRYKPENIRLELVPLDENLGNNSADSNEPRDMRCRADAFPRAKYNISMPSGTSSPLHAMTEPKEEYVINFIDPSASGNYICHACNDVGCTMITKSTNDLVNNISSGGIIVLGLPLWAIILICLGIIVLIGAALVFCFQCKDRNRYPRKKKAFSTQVTKDQISRPYNSGHSDQFNNSISSRTRLVKPAESNDREVLQKHLQLITDTRSTHQATQDFLKNSHEELLLNRQTDYNHDSRHENVYNDMPRDDYNDHDNIPTPAQRNTKEAMINASTPGGTMPSTSVQRETSNASNRPYSEHYGYGSTQGSVNHGSTIPRSSNNLNNSNYANNYGYGAPPVNNTGIDQQSTNQRFKSQQQLHTQQPEHYAETTLI